MSGRGKNPNGKRKMQDEMISKKCGKYISKSKQNLNLQKKNNNNNLLCA